MRKCSVFRPRIARNESNGPATAPTELCRNAICSANALLPPATTTPPTMSEWPLRYFVAECSTRSAPYSSGRCRIGEQNVLSTTKIKPCLRANAPTFARSTTVSIGLVGVSAQTMRVFGFSAGLDFTFVDLNDAAAHTLEQPVRA